MLYEWIDDGGTRHYFAKDSEDQKWKDAFDPERYLYVFASATHILQKQNGIF